MSGAEHPVPARPTVPVEPAYGMPGSPLDRTWTLPNVISFLRLAGAPLMFYLIVVPQADVLAVAVLAVGGFTDWLDGFLARRWQQVTRLGQALDPIADRLYILAALFGLALREIVPWWLVALLVGRDVLITSLLALARRYRGITKMPVHYVGKIATFCLLYAFPLVLLGDGEDGWLQIAGIVGWAFVSWGTLLYSYVGVLYVGQEIRVLRSWPPGHRPRSLPPG